MKRQETLNKRYDQIVSIARTLDGRDLDYYYNNCSYAKRCAYEGCLRRIPKSAKNVHYCVGSANTYNFTFYAVFKLIDPVGKHWYIARYESREKIETIGFRVEEVKFYELPAHEIICW